MKGLTIQEVEDLVRQWQCYKEDEDAAKAMRRNIAESIAARLDHPTEGSKTHTVGPYKVTVKGGVNRKVDWVEFDTAAERRKEPHAPFKPKKELDIKGLHYIEKNHPEYYLELCEAITSTPAAVQITVKEATTSKKAKGT